MQSRICAASLRSISNSAGSIALFRAANSAISIITPAFLYIAHSPRGPLIRVHVSSGDALSPSLQRK